MKPLSNNIVVRPIEEKQSSIIVTTTEDVSNKGEIVAMGPGKQIEPGTFLPMEVNIGDKIIHSTAFRRVDVDGEKLLVMAEDNIIVVI